MRYLPNGSRQQQSEWRSQWATSYMGERVCLRLEDLGDSGIIIHIDSKMMWRTLICQLIRKEYRERLCGGLTKSLWPPRGTTFLMNYFEMTRKSGSRPLPFLGFSPQPWWENICKTCICCMLAICQSMSGISGHPHWESQGFHTS